MQEYSPYLREQTLQLNASARPHVSPTGPTPFKSRPLYSDKPLRAIPHLTAPTPAKMTLSAQSQHYPPQQRYGSPSAPMPLECPPERIATWLEELGILQSDPADVHDTHASAQAINSAHGVSQQHVIDLLYQQLKDGVALLHLMNRIQSGSVSSINLHTDRPFAALDNINQFLAACAALGITEKESFDVNDLYFRADFQKVLRTLAVLGRKADALQQQGRIPYCPSLFSPPAACAPREQGSSFQPVAGRPFAPQQHAAPLASSSSTALTQLARPNQEPYRQAFEAPSALVPTSTVKKVTPPTPQTGVIVQNTYAVALYQYSAKMDDEVSFQEGDIVTIYRRMDGGWWEGEAGGKRGWLPSNYVQVLEGATPTSSTHSSVHHPQPAQPVADEADKRRAHETLVRQMLNAEQAYVASIEGFVMSFVEPLRNKEWLSETEFKSLESCMQLAWYAQNGLEEMLQRQATQLGPANMSIGACFLELGNEILNTYTRYADNRAFAEDVLERYRHHAEMTSFLQSLGWHRDPPIVHISAFILKPLQRLQNYYPLLLQELLKVTPAGHPDQVHLPKAMDMLTQVNEQVSLHRADLENRTLLKNVSERIEGWDGPPLCDFGHLVMEGVLRLYKGDQCRDIFCFFLERLVVVLQRSMKGWQDGSSGKYKLIEVVPLVKDAVSILDVKDCADIRNAFILELRNPQGKSKEVILSAFTAASKQAWLDKLIEQVGKNTGTQAEEEEEPRPHTSSKLSSDAQSTSSVHTTSSKHRPLKRSSITGASLLRKFNPMHLLDRKSSSKSPIPPKGAQKVDNALPPTPAVSPHALVDGVQDGTHVAPVHPTHAQYAELLNAFHAVQHHLDSLSDRLGRLEDHVYHQSR